MLVLLIYVVLYFFFFFFKQKTAYEMLRSLVGSEMCIRDSSYTGGTPRNIKVGDDADHDDLVVYECLERDTDKVGSSSTTPKDTPLSPYDAHLSFTPQANRSMINFNKYCAGVGNNTSFNRGDVFGVSARSAPSSSVVVDVSGPPRSNSMALNELLLLSQNSMGSLSIKLSPTGSPSLSPVARRDRRRQSFSLNQHDDGIPVVTTERQQSHQPQGGNNDTMRHITSIDDGGYLDEDQQQLSFQQHQYQHHDTNDENNRDIVVNVFGSHGGYGNSASISCVGSDEIDKNGPMEFSTSSEPLQ
eukprot:TRINITY_DN20188_c0_g1_i3.p1 TRINITY_DN20188_c0_g1~~TRINITY_DN20188_c0_g1_i3.p1  ORF type:complete len:301 (+),score=59.83 TRINITY_DN20188_c0_g1_i3:52-954(+)